jgi:two-component system sensor histidine kinase CpxA
LRKLYLKIVAAIWTVMLVSAVGVALVVNVVMPDERFRPRGQSASGPLADIADRASAATRGTGKDGLAAWFEKYLAQPRLVGQVTVRDGGESKVRVLGAAGPPLVLLDSEGNVLAGNSPPAVQGPARGATGSPNRPSVQQHDFTHDGERYRIVLRHPLPRNFARTFALVTLRPPSVWLLLPIAIPLSVILSFGIARYLVRPLRAMEEAGRRLSDGDFSARVGPSLGNRGDEIADFAAAFDQMAMRIESLVRTHKVLLRDVSHELRSPLARAHAALSLARQRTNGVVDNELDRLETEIGRLDGMIGKLLAFSRLDSAERPISREPVELSGLLAEIAQDSEFEAKADGKRVQLRNADPVTVSGHPELLSSCFENVVRNAVRHTADDTVVEITLSCRRDSSRSCLVEIRDHGDGVPADQLQQIFEPFHRVDDGAGASSGRSGIGLAIARRAVNLHGGTICAANAAGGGLVVSVSLPVDDAKRNRVLRHA